MRRLMCVVAVFTLLASGCTREPAEEPTETPTPTETPSPEPPPVAPLTGIEVDDPIERPVLAVKFDNATAALPPDGLDAADIVFEEEVEGGLTRFLALFHSQDPKQVGPVRSAREVDADLLPPYQAALAMSGAANVVDRLMARAGITVLEDDDHMDAYFRAPDRIAPHDLLTKTEPLWKAADESAPPEDAVFTFDEETPEDGRPTGHARVDFSPNANAEWTWNAKRDHWERLQNQTPHVTADGDTITADNVIFMRIKTSPGDRTDSAGNPTVAMDVIGRGNAVVLRDGQRFRAKWAKASPEDHIEWLDSSGSPVVLLPGQTWIELVDVEETVNFRKNPKPAEE